jgi:hypothetical protein
VLDQGQSVEEEGHLVETGGGHIVGKEKDQGPKNGIIEDLDHMTLTDIQGQKGKRKE